MGQLTDLYDEPVGELTQVLDRLVRRFPDISERWLWEQARTAHERFRAAPVRTFVPLLVEKQVAMAVRRASAVGLRAADRPDAVPDWKAEAG
jgi:hypothetical protein